MGFNSAFKGLMRKSILFHGQVGIMMAMYTFVIIISQDEQVTELNLITKFNVSTMGFL
jgi:hypothetical protein